ncbi:MAG: hypothetical protein Q9M94_02045 [Candidatus Gracilibacteria bacterium]|nr:hypothetical protein [Candidatus Gracilibacteria bacterium]MDQ7023101.1 hypothetical protein [Candidatus Gracilibacteria bacterium]
MKKGLNEYVEANKKELKFEYIKGDIKLKDTLYQFSAYVSLLYYEEIEKSDDDDELMEMKIHTAFVYLGSIVEALLYYFVEKKIGDSEKSRRKYLEIEEYKKLQNIAKTDNLYICELVKKEINFNDSINFNALINGAKYKKIVNEEILLKINDLRKYRNSVHINVYKSGGIIVFDKLEKAFIDTKEIFDYIEENL